MRGRLKKCSHLRRILGACEPDFCMVLCLGCGVDMREWPETVFMVFNQVSITQTGFSAVNQALRIDRNPCSTLQQYETKACPKSCVTWHFAIFLVANHRGQLLMDASDVRHPSLAKPPIERVFMQLRVIHGTCFSGCVSPAYAKAQEIMSLYLRVL